MNPDFNNAESSTKAKNGFDPLPLFFLVFTLHTYLISLVNVVNCRENNSVRVIC